MTTFLHRRALISGTLALPLASPTAAAPITSPDHPDAALLALQTEIDAAERAWKALFREKTAAEERYFAMRPSQPHPQEIASNKALMRALGGDEIDEAARKALEDFRATGQADEHARQASGLKAAEEAEDEADKRILAIRNEKIIPTRATTLDGLIFKARYAASHFEGDPDEDVMLSIVDDLLALKGEPDSSSLDGRPSGAPDVDA